ncbi:ATP synthase subunit H domain containing protein [Amanita muscaria]
MGSIIPVFSFGAIVVVLMICVALFTPKGPNQAVIRTALMLTLATCYLLWMITYLAQLHPLIGECCLVLVFWKTNVVFLAPVRTVKSKA